MRVDQQLIGILKITRKGEGKKKPYITSFIEHI
jgi:hypothetical protein